MLRLYFHPSCATSYEMITSLMKTGMIERVELVPSVDPAIALRHGVWSVPWLVIDGIPLATDPVTAEETIALVSGERVDVGDPVEAFMYAVLHSSFASAVAVLHNSLKPVINEDLASAAIRAPLSGLSARKVVEEVSARSDELLEEWRDRIRRALAVSFVREIYWATGGQATPSDVETMATSKAVGLWLIAKASVGRSALPIEPHRVRQEDLEAIASFVARSARGLLNKVAEEQRTIYGDPQYMGIVRRVLGVSL